MKLNEKLREFRIKSNLTQRELAKKLGISIPTLQKYEYGTLKLKSEIIVKICKVFDIGINDFLDKIILSDNEKMELDFIESMLEIDDERIKDNMDNVNFVLDNALLNLENRQKYLLYFLANNKNAEFHIPKNKKTLEIHFFSNMLKSEAATVIRSEDLEILLNLLYNNIELLFHNFLNLANIDLFYRALKDDEDNNY